MTKQYHVDHVNKVATGVGCWTYVGEVEYIESFGRKTGSKNTSWNNQGRWEDIIQTDCKEKAWKTPDWINLSQNKHKWPYFLKVVMNFTLLILCMFL